MIDKPLWQPNLGTGGFPQGVYLDKDFAAGCDTIPLTPELRQRCESYVWSIVKPKNKTNADRPSNIFTWWGDPELRHESSLGEGRTSLLISGVYVRHESSNGKWLTVDHYSVSRFKALSYSFHHASLPDDHHYNRWLLYAFSRWVQFAENVMHEQLSA